MLMYRERNIMRRSAAWQIRFRANRLQLSISTNTSFASPRSRADGVMIVFFPTAILEFPRIADRTSSSHTKPVGLITLLSILSALGFEGSSSLNDDSGGAIGGTEIAWVAAPERPPSHWSTT